MGAIKYTSIINSFVSTEGVAGIMTNYIYYSLLVVYCDGTKEIVEGKKENLGFLLDYLRTPVDELQEIKQLIASLPSDVNNINDNINEKMNCILDTVYPIPDVRGMKEEEALQQLEENEFVPHKITDIVSDNKGMVSFVRRNKLNYKHVDVGITHSIPSVEGLTKDVAIEVLKKVGFQANVKNIPCREYEQDIVLHYGRVNDMSAVVELEVGSVPKDIQAKKAIKNYDDWTAWDGINPQGKKAVNLLPLDSEYFGECPNCGSEQRSNRQVCWQCGIPFMYTE